MHRVAETGYILVLPISLVWKLHLLPDLLLLGCRDCRIGFESIPWNTHSSYLLPLLCVEMRVILYQRLSPDLNLLSWLVFLWPYSKLWSPWCCGDGSVSCAFLLRTVGPCVPVYALLFAALMLIFYLSLYNLYSVVILAYTCLLPSCSSHPLEVTLCKITTSLLVFHLFLLPGLLLF